MINAGFLVQISILICTNQTGAKEQGHWRNLAKNSVVGYWRDAPAAFAAAKGARWRKAGKRGAARARSELCRGAVASRVFDA
jgi:hypothetical protein